MAKKKPASKNKSRSGHPAVRAAAAKAASHGGDGVARKFEALRAPFVQWLRESYPLDDPDSSEDIADVLEQLFDRYAGELRSAPNLTSLDHARVSELLDYVRKQDPELAEALAEGLHDYLHFLVDTGRWTGTDAGQAALHQAVSSGEDDDVLPDIVLPTLSAAQAREQAEALPLWQRTRALLEWVGTGKGVTGTGVLRRKDIQAAAAAVGTNAVGTDGRLGAVLPNDLPHDTVWAHSMTEVPRLARYWHALWKAGFLKVGSTRARLAPLGQQVLDGGQAPDAVARAMAVQLYTGILLHQDNFFGLTVAQDLRRVTLVAAGSAAPPSFKEVFVEERDDPWDVLPGLRTEIADWADDGLITLGSHVVVPDVLRDPLARAVQLTSGGDAMFAAPGISGQLLPEQAADRPPAQPKAEVPTFALKVQIDGIEPPVWRRVEVRADLPLSEFHDIIQSLFAWDHSHLHAFRTGGRRGITYQMQDYRDDPWSEQSGDEAATVLSDVLARVGSKLKYEYDFGDSWLHTITLKQRLSPAQPGTLPRCTAGEGMARMKTPAARGAG